MLSSAFRAVWDKKKIDAIQNRLNGYRRELHTHLLTKHSHNMVNLAEALARIEAGNTVHQQEIMSAIRTLQSDRSDSRNVMTQHITAVEAVLNQIKTDGSQENLRSVLSNIQAKIDSLLISKDLSEAAGIQEHLFSNNSQHLITRQEIQTVQRTLVGLEDKLVVPQASAHISQDELQQQFLDDLYLRILDRREEQVSCNTPGTFDWMYEGVESERWSPEENAYVPYIKHTGFREWLTNGQELYWISGKAGAGKSTLMKYITDDHRTRSALEEWAGSATLITTSNYLWISGDPIQRSLTGLLRALLYQILDQNRDLISVLFPREWRRYARAGYRKSEWIEEDFNDAIKLLKALPSLTHKFCFFMDGLDEFEGVIGCDGLSKLLVDLCQISYIKMCVSSRPRTGFENAFSGHLTIKVDEWTTRDIERFVGEQLEQHPLWLNVLQLDPKFGVHLSKEVCQRAEGVFLWVALVVRTLGDGLQAGDRPAQLETRLRQMPNDLTDFFGRMLQELGTSERQRVEKILPYLLAGYRIVPIFLYYLQDQDPNFGQSAQIKHLTPQQMVAKAETIQCFLKYTCKDLLDIGNLSRTTHNKSNKTELIDFYDYWSSDCSPQFSHRTLKDYLNTAEARSLIKLQDVSDEQYSHWELQATLAELKTLSWTLLGDDCGKLFDRLLGDFSAIVHPPFMKTPISNSYLDELCLVTNRIFSSIVSHLKVLPRIHYECVSNPVIVRRFETWAAILSLYDWLEHITIQPDFTISIDDLIAVLKAVVGGLTYSHSFNPFFDQHVRMPELIGKRSKDLYQQGVNDRYIDVGEKGDYLFGRLIDGKFHLKMSVIDCTGNAEHIRILCGDGSCCKDSETILKGKGKYSTEIDWIKLDAS